MKRRFVVVDLTDPSEYRCYGSSKNHKTALGIAYHALNEGIDHSGGDKAEIKFPELLKIGKYTMAGQIIEATIDGTDYAKIGILFDDTKIEELSMKQVEKYRFTHPEYCHSDTILSI
jgi:hypothetical protein